MALILAEVSLGELVGFFLFIAIIGVVLLILVGSAQRCREDPGQCLLEFAFFGVPALFIAAIAGAEGGLLVLIALAAGLAGIIAGTLSE